MPSRHEHSQHHHYPVRDLTLTVQILLVSPVVIAHHNCTLVCVVPMSNKTRDTIATTRSLAQLSLFQCLPIGTTCCYCCDVICNKGGLLTVSLAPLSLSQSSLSVAAMFLHPYPSFALGMIMKLRLWPCLYSTTSIYQPRKLDSQCAMRILLQSLIVLYKSFIFEQLSRDLISHHRQAYNR